MKKSHIVTASIALTCFLLTSLAYSFGNSGRDGSNGWDGRDGRDGLSVSHVATGASAILDLRGGHGGDGDDGDDGSRAYSCRQNCGAYSETGASGGDGGDGGDGGRGGNGGNAVVYFTDIANLRNVTIQAAPGIGGDGGNPGDGSYGCNCSVRSWTARVKEKYKKDGHWHEHYVTRRFYCTDGRDGRRGSYGSDGRNGQMGTVTLVQSAQKLAQSNSTVKVSFGDFALNPQKMSRHLYDRKVGARSLFSASSDIRDDYFLYTNTIHKTVKFKWLSDRPLEMFAELQVSLSLGADGEVAVSLPSNLWFERDVQVTGDVVTVTIKKMFKQAEVGELEMSELVGKGRDLKLVILDNAGLSSSLGSKIKLRYRTSSRLIGLKLPLGYSTRFEGTVPAELVDVEDDRLVVHIGQIESIREKYLKGNWRVKIHLEVERSFNDKSLTWDADDKYRLRK